MGTAADRKAAALPAHRAERISQMETLTKQEIKWLANFCRKKSENSKKAREQHPSYYDRKEIELMKLDEENMDTLNNKLELILLTESKRIAVK